MEANTDINTNTHIILPNNSAQYRGSLKRLHVGRQTQTVAEAEVITVQHPDLSGTESHNTQQTGGGGGRGNSDIERRK